MDRRIDHHPGEERFKDSGQREHGRGTKGRFRSRSKSRERPERPEKHFQRSGGGRSRDVLYSTTCPSQPKENSTLASVNVESTKPEHATLFTNSGRLSARQDDSFDSGVHVLLNCGARSHFMSMQTAKSAQLCLYTLTHPGHIMTTGGVQVDVRYYTRAYVPVAEFTFRHHFTVLEILPDMMHGLRCLRS